MDANVLRSAAGIRGDHHAATLEALHIDIAGGSHRTLQRTNEVRLAIRFMARSEQDLLQRPNRPTVVR